MVYDKIIIWDGYGFCGKAFGVVNYAVNILEQVNKLSLYPYVWLDGYNELFENYKNIYIISLNNFTSIVRYKLIWPHFVYFKSWQLGLLEKHTIFHGLSNINLPIWAFPKKTKFVITIHDIIPIIAKNLVSSSLYLHFAFILPKVINQADKIICISQWTKNTLMEFCKVDESKIVVIPNGIEISNILKNKTKTRTNMNKINLLFVGRFEKYKNFDFLLNLVKNYKDKFILHIVTNDKGRDFCIRNAIDLIRCGILKLHVNMFKKDLAQLYLNTDVYVHPSFYEGFCLPAAEALSYGVPVVYMKGSGIDEVVGSDVGIGLSRQSSQDMWISAIESMYYQSQKEDFLVKVQNYLHTKRNWKLVALDLIDLYNTL